MAMQKPPFRPKGQKRPENDHDQPGSGPSLTTESITAAYISAIDESFRIVDEKLAGQDKLEPDNAAAVFLAQVLKKMIVRWGPKATAKAIETFPNTVGQAALPLPDDDSPLG
jgi:hypothetical protein